MPLPEVKPIHCCQVAEDSDRQEFLKLGPAAGLYLADQVVDLEQLYQHYDEGLSSPGPLQAHRKQVRLLKLGPVMRKIVAKVSKPWVSFSSLGGF